MAGVESFIRAAAADFINGQPQNWRRLASTISLRALSYVSTDLDSETAWQITRELDRFLFNPALLLKVSSDTSDDVMNSVAERVHTFMSAVSSTRGRRSLFFDEADRLPVRARPARRTDDREVQEAIYRIRPNQIQLDTSFTHEDARFVISTAVQALTLDEQRSTCLQLDVIDLSLYKAIVQHPKLLQTLHWRTFEKLLADILERFGYEIELQRGSKDGGVDLYAVRRSDYLGPERYIVQAKRWSNHVGVEPVRELMFLQTHERATKACLATTARFTKGAWELAAQYSWQLHLRDFDGLLEWVRRIERSKG